MVKSLGSLLNDCTPFVFGNLFTSQKITGRFEIVFFHVFFCFYISTFISVIQSFGSDGNNFLVCEILQQYFAHTQCSHTARHVLRHQIDHHYCVPVVCQSSDVIVDYSHMIPRLSNCRYCFAIQASFGDRNTRTEKRCFGMTKIFTHLF